jgi:hypothetical protein
MTKIATLLLLLAVVPPPEPQRTVSAPGVRFVEPGLSYNFQLPITVKVRSDSISRLADVQVRIFPQRTKESAVRGAASVTTSGCHIFPSRVEGYTPSFAHPHIRLDSIYAEDLRCVDGYLAPTDYVLVVESSDNADDRFLRIAPGQVARYFRNAYSFKVNPVPRQECGWRLAGVARPARAAPPRRRPTAAVAAERAAVAEHDVPQSCIDRVQ